MKKITSILLVVFILLMSIASAEEFVVQQYNSDFSLSSSSQVCSCNAVPVSLQNNADFSSPFTILSTAPLSTTAVVLSAGQSVDFTANLVDCKPEKITAVNGYGQRKSLLLQPQKVDCAQSSFRLNKVNMTASACKDINSSLYITNQAPYAQKYTIHTTPATTSLSAGSVTIPSNMTATINATFRYSCQESGSKNIVYTIATPEKSYKVEQNVVLSDNYSFELSSQPELNLCRDKPQQISARIKNNANFSNRFDLSVQGPAILQNNSFWIEAGKTESVLVNVTASTTKDIIIQATSYYGKSTASYTINTSVANCYDVDIILPSMHSCVDELTTRKATIINKGTKSVNATLQSTAGEVRPSNVLLPAGNASDITIILEPKKVGLTTQTFSVQSEHLTVQESFDFAVNSKDTCYATSLESDMIAVHYSENSSSFTLQNSGTNYGEYALDVSGNIALENTTVRLGSSETKTIPFSFRNELLPGQKIVVNITATRHSDKFINQLTILVHDDPLWQQAYEKSSAWVKKYPCLSVTLLLLLGLVIALLFTSSWKRPRVSIFVVALILAVLAALWVGPLPQLYTSYDLQTNSTTHLLLSEDQSRLFNLSDFFSDPDGNIVRYTVVSNNMSVLNTAIQDNQLLLEPTSNFNGDTIIRLSASDSYNETAVSQDIRVDILPVEDYSLWGLYDLLCSHINLLLFIVLLLIITFKTGKSKPVLKRPKYY